MSAAPTRPVVRYHGGKWRLAPWIITMFPPHRIYVEPFGGGASVLMRKPRAYGEVYNDLETEIVNLFRVLRDPVQALELRRRIELTTYSREEFVNSYTPPVDSVDLAHKTVIRSFMGFGSASMTRTHKTGFRSNSNRSGSTPASDWVSWPTQIPAMVERLRGVTIENKAAEEVIRQHDTSQTLFYIDPPYVHDTRSGHRSSRHSYKFEMTDDDHAALAKTLHEVEGMVVVSGYACSLYDEELYADWQRYERRHFADGARERVEVVWLNPATAEALQNQ